MGEGVTKDGNIILHQIYRFRGSVHSWGSRVHQTKSRYYLGPFQNLGRNSLWKLFSAISCKKQKAPS